MTAADTPSTRANRTAPISAEQGAHLIILGLLAVLATMTTVFGLPGLAMTALALVPVMFVVLLLITVGK